MTEIAEERRSTLAQVFDHMLAHEPLGDQAADQRVELFLVARHVDVDVWFFIYIHI